MIDIDFSSGKVKADTSGATAGVTTGQQKAGVHLTKGYVSPDAAPPTQQNNPPVVVTGEVDVHVDTQQEVDQVLNGSWFFGFLQVARVKELSASWEGRRAGEGSVTIFIVGFPVSDDLVLLDSDPANQPFYDRIPHAGFARRPVAGQRRLVHVTTSMGDHPNYRDALVTANSVTKSKNFLESLHMVADFTTVLVGRDGNGPILPIAHVKWDISLHGRIKWRGGVPSGTSQLSSVVAGASTVGAPADARVKSVIDNPGPPLAKGVVIDRYRLAMSNPRMRQEDAKRSLLLKRDFFQ